MGTVDTIVDGATSALEKLDKELEGAEKAAKSDKAKEKIAEWRKKIKVKIDELKDWKKNKNDAQKAFDILLKLLDELATELPKPIEKYVKAMLEALASAMDTAYGLVLKKMEKYINNVAKDPKHPTDEELDEAAKDASAADWQWVKLLWKTKHLETKVVDEP